MKQNLSPTAIVVAIVVVLAVISLIGWKVMAGGGEDLPGADEDQIDATMQQDMMESMQQGGAAGGSAPPPAGE